MLTVADHRVIVPGALPQLVEHLEVLLGDAVAVVMGHLVGEAEVPRGIGQVGGDDVPAESPLGEVIEGARASREGEGRLVRGGERGGESEVLGHRSHRGDHEQRVIARNLHALPQRRLRTAAVSVVGSDDIREKHRVEETFFEELRLLDPEVEVVEPVPRIGRMHPQSV